MGHERPGLLALRLFVVAEPKRVFAVTKHVFLLGFMSFFLHEGHVASVALCCYITICTVCFTHGISAKRSSGWKTLSGLCFLPFFLLWFLIYVSPSFCYGFWFILLKLLWFLKSLGFVLCSEPHFAALAFLQSYVGRLHKLNMCIFVPDNL